MSVSVAALARTVSAGKRKNEGPPPAPTAASLDGLVSYMRQNWQMEPHEALQVLRRLCGLGITNGGRAQEFIFRKNTPDGIQKNYVRMWDAQLRQFYNNTNWDISMACAGDQLTQHPGP